MTTKNFLLFQSGKQGGISGRTIPEELFKPENFGKVLTLRGADDVPYLGVEDLPRLFIADFGRTPFLDVKNAYDGGAVVVCYRNDMLYQLSSFNGFKIEFARTLKDADDKILYATATVTEGGWVSSDTEITGGGIPEAPSDDRPFVRKNGDWEAYAPQFTFGDDVDVREFAEAVASGKTLIYGTTVTNPVSHLTSSKQFNLSAMERRAGGTTITMLFERVEGTILSKVTIWWDVMAETMTFGDVENYDVSSSGGGGSTTLFKNVADMQAASLNVGDVVETQRFYAFSQRVFDDDYPGGCQYRIIDNPSSTDLAEGLGMDLIELNNGHYAKAILLNEAYPEQIGYKLQYGPSNGVDLTPYIQRLAKLGVTHIKLNRTSHYNGPDSQNAVYRIKDKCELTRSVRISGTHASSSGYSTVISFTPSASNTDKVMFECEKRDIIIEDVILNNPASGDVANNGTCIKISNDGSSAGTSSLGNQFYRLNIQGFKYGLYGASGFLWHVSVNHCVWANNYINVRLERLVYTMKFYNCLFNCPKYRSIEVESPFTLEFDTCNFGVRPTNDCLLYFKRWYSPDEVPAINEREGNVRFSNSQMEYEKMSDSVSDDAGKGKFVYCTDDTIATLLFDNVVFIITPLVRADNLAVRLFSFGENSAATFRGCLGPLADVDNVATGHVNYILEKDYDKVFFDENRPCRKMVGGIRIENSYGLNPLALIPDSHLSAVVLDSNAILTSNGTDISDFYRVPEGTQMLNLDEKKVQVFTSGKLVNINSLPSNLVRIGNELYEYVTIDGRLWITRNLNLRTVNKNYTYWNHLNFGQYYSSSDVDVIATKLPAGWRIPLDADINSLVGDGSTSRARALQAKGYSAWSNATNSLGFGMTPSYYWKRPSQASESNFNTGFLYCQYVTDVGRRTILLRENSVTMSGWPPSTLPDRIVPVRVCADA